MAASCAALWHGVRTTRKGGGGERLEVEEKGIGGGGATMEGRIGQEGL
jgi:hypothetical protein